MIPYINFFSFNLGPIKIYSWGFFVSLGIVFAITVLYFFAKKEKLEYQKIPDLGFWVILAAMLGGRVFYIIGEAQYYWQNPLSIFKVWEGGMSMSGGLVFAVIAAIIFCRKNQWQFWRYAQAAAFSLPLGIGIGRLGCFFIFDHPGEETSFFLGERYMDGLIRHNHGLYLSIEGFLIFILFLILYKLAIYKKNPFIFVSLFLILDGLTRLILDFWRIADPTYFGLTIAQYLGIVMIIGGSYLFISKKLN